MYKVNYKKEYDKIDVEEVNVKNGLDKLAEAAEQIRKLKETIAEKSKDLGVKNEALNELKKVIETEAAAASEVKRVCEIDKAKCEAVAATVNAEKLICQKDMEAAMPILKEATGALDQIKGSDISELKSYSKLDDVLKLIFDCCALILQKPIGDQKATKNKLKKEDVDGIEDSQDK